MFECMKTRRNWYLFKEISFSQPFCVAAVPVIRPLYLLLFSIKAHTAMQWYNSSLQSFPFVDRTMYSCGGNPICLDLLIEPLLYVITHIILTWYKCFQGFYSASNVNNSIKILTKLKHFGTVQACFQNNH